MSLIFERIQTDGIAELSYLVGDDTEGAAAVFDPRPALDMADRTRSPGRGRGGHGSGWGEV
jgi:hypothetical protein